MIKSIITPRAGGFELSFGSTQKPPFQARLFFTGQKDDRDANLLLLLLEDPTLQEPALLRTGLRHLFERTEIFVRQHEAQMEGYDTSTARRQP